ncbi:uncharacterized protein CG7065 isoform X2 [Halyomorpha halys]|nr:uncharacterized protein CG7065-like isoform X2 [Halyomorpha halys]
MLMHLSHPVHMSRLRLPHHPPENFQKIINSKDEVLNPFKNRKPDGIEESNCGFNKNDTSKTFPEKQKGDNANNVPNQDKYYGKLSFSIGKPERSLGRKKATEQPNKQLNNNKNDDEVKFDPSNNESIEVQSTSMISAQSDPSRMMRHRSRSPLRSRSRSRGRGRMRSPLGRMRSPLGRMHSPLGRMRSPLRRRGRSIERRRTPPFRGDRHRSRSRSRHRYFRDPIYTSGSRDASDRLKSFPKARRSLSREKDRDRARYESRDKIKRMERDRHRRSYSSERDRKRESPLPKGRYEKSPELNRKKSQTHNKSKMESYSSKLHDLEVDMDDKLKYYRENPEKHPQYSEEWKSFWNRRYKEIQQSGKDPNSYDFKPEWITFWDERMKNLHEEELIAKKEELKTLFPEEEKGARSDLHDMSPPTPDNQKDITGNDTKNTRKTLTGSDIKAPKQKSPSQERKSPVRSPSPREQENRKPGKAKHSWDLAPPIVHCLRMLSVLEQQLGSLGPKALELLSKALSMEKTKYTDSMTLLQDEEIHIFFETLKEKIRGQLIAGIVERYLVASCRSVINTIESMLAAYPSNSTHSQVPPTSSVVTATPSLVPPAPSLVSSAVMQPEPVKVASVGMINKMAVAQQIAEALVVQGWTDVSQQELEELINAVVGIATSSNANLNQSSTSFISQLNIQKSTANSHINELLGNLIASAQKTLVSPAVVPVENIPSEVVNMATLPQVPASLVKLPYTIAPLSNPTKLLDTVADKKIEPSIKNITAPSNKSDIVQEKDDEDSNDSMSDQDLKERLVKFKSLNRDEQQNLILLLKDLESKDPQRVEKLRQYVAVGLTQQSFVSDKKSDSIPSKNIRDGRLSPFSSRTGGTNPIAEGNALSKPYAVDSDSTEDDYSVDDVYKSVSEKFRKKEDERKKEIRLNLPPDILDENNTLSRHSFSNPGKLSVTPTYSQTRSFKNDPRIVSVNERNPLQPSKSEYTYSVAKPPNLQSSESFAPSLQHNYPGQVDNPNFKEGPWAGGPEMGGNNDWSGNKQWSHGVSQDPYSAATRVSGFQNAYEGGTYSGTPNDYKTVPESYYNSEQVPHGYLHGAPVVNSYPPYNANQPYQPAMYSSQGGPYSYQKPPGQGGYYGNYRQY